MSGGPVVRRFTSPPSWSTITSSGGLSPALAAAWSCWTSAFSCWASLSKAISPPTCPLRTRLIMSSSGPLEPSLATIVWPTRRLSETGFSLLPPPLEISTISRTITSRAAPPTMKSWRRRTLAGRSRRRARRPGGGRRPLRSNSPVSPRAIRRRSPVSDEVGGSAGTGAGVEGCSRSPVPGSLRGRDGRAGASVHSNRSSPSEGGRCSISLALSAPASEGEPELAELALVDRSRSAGQRVAARGGLRECDHVANRFRAVGKSHDPVEAVGDASVRRCSVAQRVEEKAEAIFGLLLVDSDRLEHLSLHLGVADTDRATTNLPSVPDDVIGLRPGGPRVGGIELAVGRGEGVVVRVPALLVGRPAEQGPVDDPGEIVRVRIDQLEPLAEPAAKLAENLGREQRLIGHDQEDIAFGRSERLVRGLGLFVGEELGDRRAPAIGFYDRPDESLGAEIRGLRDEPIEVCSRHLVLAGVQPADKGAALDRLAESVEFRAAEDLGQVLQLQAEAQVRLVRTVTVDRLVVGQPAHRQLHLDAADGQHMSQEALVHFDHVVGVDEGHLYVQLREVGLPIRAQVLIPEAARYLKIPLEAADHQELLEQLWRLGQCVEVAALQAAGDQEVAGALRRGAGEDGGHLEHEGQHSQRQADRRDELRRGVSGLRLLPGSAPQYGL